MADDLRRRLLNGIRYIGVLEQHMLPVYQTHGCELTFQHDSAPCHTSKIVKKWMSDHSNSVSEWATNSSDLILIDNC